MILVGISGAMGRMGKLILKDILKQNDMALVAALEIAGHPLMGQDIGESIGIEKWKIPLIDSIEYALYKAEVWVEFSSPEAVMEHLPFVEKKGIPVVIGTTGFTDEQKKEIEKYSKKIPVFLSPNMSIAVNTIFSILEEVSSLFSNYDIEITETHHKKKKDAPSGTAVYMADILSNNTRKKWKMGIRENEEDKNIIVHASRMGNIAGEHEIRFVSEEDEIVIKHKAFNRGIFSKGTIEAIRFIHGQKVGIYNTRDIIKQKMKGE